MIDQICNLLDSMPKIENPDSEYYYEDNKVPRVTKIIQRCIHNDSLMYWANSLGFKHQSYQKTLNIAAAIGTQCHNNIDAFLDDQSHEPVNIMLEAKNAYDSFRKWFNDISLYANIEVIYHEKTITCKYFGGTLDGLYKINGKIYIVDYKTSNHVTFNYCLQLAAYIFMLERELGIKVDGCIILQLSKTEVAYNEYMLNFDNQQDKIYMEECKEAFLVMVLWYYYINMIENGFNSIDWGK